MYGRTVLLGAFALVLLAGATLVLSAGARDAAAAAAARGALFWLVVLGLIALGVWAVRTLPPRRRRRRSPPGVSWFPSGTWWGDRKHDE